MSNLEVKTREKKKPLNYLGFPCFPFPSTALDWRLKEDDPQRWDGKLDTRVENGRLLSSKGQGAREVEGAGRRLPSDAV